MDERNKKADALSEVVGGTKEIFDIVTEPMITQLDYSQAAADGITKGITVTAVSAALIAEMIAEKIKDKK